MPPTVKELESLETSPAYIAGCSHENAEFYNDYDDVGCCAMHFQYGEEWTEDLQQIEEFGGGYICLIHDFPRDMSIEDRLKVLTSTNQPAP